MKKGQSALEYLMTYGWALLILVIVGIALYSLGVFNPKRFASSEACVKGTYITCGDKLVKSGINQTTLIFVVGAKDLKNPTFTLSFVSPSGATVDTTNMTCTKTPGSSTWLSGEQITCSKITVSGLSPGDQYRLKANFTFTDPDSGLTHTDEVIFIGVAS